MTGRVLVIVLALSAAGCLGQRRLTDEELLRSSAGVERMRGVLNVAERRDAGAVPKLIDRLEDDDSAVRLAAISSLRRMTGQDFGYVAYDDGVRRAAAVARWREWWRQQGAGATTPGAAGGGSP